MFVIDTPVGMFHIQKYLFQNKGTACKATNYVGISHFLLSNFIFV